MKRTTNYALPDWEKSDFIQMSDFNDLTHKLDTALKNHDDTLNTKTDTSSVTAVQQEVAAAREANCLVKLAGPLVTTAANAAMEFDLSQVDMTKVAALFVVFSAGGSGEIKLSANDTVVSSICSNNFILEASNPVPTPLLGHRCRSSQEITCSPTPFLTSNHYLWICESASFSLSNPNIAA